VPPFGRLKGSSGRSAISYLITRVPGSLVVGRIRAGLLLLPRARTDRGAKIDHYEGHFALVTMPGQVDQVMKSDDAQSRASIGVFDSEVR
jgi:hypothetical protein